MVSHVMLAAIAGRTERIRLGTAVTVRAGPGQLHHDLSIEFDLEAERQAKELALGVGEIIAVPIIEVLDLGRSPVWPDVVDRPSTAP